MMKTDLPSSYRLIQWIAIGLAVLSLFTSAPYGVIFWGVFAWLMVKRKYETLRLMAIVGLGLILMGTLGLLWMLESNTSLVTLDQRGIYLVFVLFGLMASYLHWLKGYFKRLASNEPLLRNNASDGSADQSTGHGENRYYEQAVREAEGSDRVISLWAKCYSAANGADGPAKAAYIRERVEQLSSIQSNKTTSGHIEQNEAVVKTVALGISYTLLGLVAVVLAFLIVVAISFWVSSQSSDELSKGYAIQGISAGQRTTMECAGEGGEKFTLTLEGDVIHISRNVMMTGKDEIGPARVTTKSTKMLAFDGKGTKADSSQSFVYSGVLSAISGHGSVTFNNWLGSKYSFICRKIGP